MMTTMFSGLALGGLYAIISMLLTVPLTRCGIINFAQAFYVVLGGFVIVELTERGWRLPFVLVALLVMGAVLGAAQEILTVRPTRGSHETALVTAVGIGIAIEGFILAVWGSNPLSFEFFAGDESLRLFGGVLQPVDLWLIGLAIVGAAGLQYASRHTRWGALGRAAMMDETAARLRGINIPRLRTSAFAFAGALSCAASLVIGAKTGVSVDTTLRLVVFSFAAAAVGGFGSFVGTAIGGFVVGLVEAFGARYLNVDWVPILIFAMLCAVLTVRPTGLLGSRHLRAV